MSDLFADIRYAARGLRRRPGFALAVLLLLGVGIGASSVLFTLARATLGQRPPHIVQADRLVRLNRTAEGAYAGSLAYPDYAFYRDENRTLAGLAAYARSLIPIMLRAGPTLTQVDVGLVSGEYFDVLGVRPVRGRLLRPEDDRGVGGPQVAVISHTLWQTLFDGRPDAVGAQVTLGAQPFQVVGVAPPGFRGASLSEQVPDLWLPLTLQPLVALGDGDPLHRVPGNVDFWLEAVGRLRPGVGVEAASADLTALAARLEREFAEWNAGSGIRVSADARYHPSLRRRMVRTMRLLGAVTLIILIIACGNVGLLLLARGATRSREMGIRRSLGAGRARVVRFFLVESVLLAVLGAFAGIVLALWSSRAVGMALLAASGVPFQPDLVVVGLTVLVALASVLLFGVAPALVVSRPGIVDLLKTETSGSPRGARLRAGLVVTQVALSLVLVTGAGLLVRSALAAQAVELGFAPAGRLVMRIDLERTGIAPARGTAFLREARTRLRAVPGAEQATFTRQVPFRGEWSGGFQAEGVPAPSEGGFDAGLNAVGPEYFTAMGIPLVAGREFTDADDQEGPPVVVVNEALARMVWGDADPIGRVLSRGSAYRFTVVGMVRDARYYDLGERARPQLYLTPFQIPLRALNVLVRTTGDPASVAPAVVRALRDVEPALVVGAVSTLDAVVGAETRPYRILAVVLSCVGAIALLLAALGLYGVLAYLVTRRAREFGIRIALGAPQGRVARDVVGYGVRLALSGIAIGLAGAWAATHLARSFLFGVDVHDPIAFAAAALALAAVAVVASYLPARRARGVDPMEALRHE